LEKILIDNSNERVILFLEMGLIKVLSLDLTDIYYEFDLLTPISSCCLIQNSDKIFLSTKNNSLGLLNLVGSNFTLLKKNHLD
jgi:hypothetical protein